jgi:hypothetical protein
MMNLAHYPLVLFAASFLALTLSAWTGVWLARGRRAVEDEDREEFNVVHIDSPRRGFIHVKPQNLLSLAESLLPR